MFRALKCDLNKTIVNIGFVGAIITVLLLCFTATVYRDDTTGRTFTVIEALSSLDREVIESDHNCASYNVFTAGLSGYAKMFLPIIVSFPFMISFCAERNNGLMRFAIVRTGKTKYYISKFITALVSGGLSVMIGFMLFGVACAILFPPLSSYEIEPILYEILRYDRIPESIVKMIINAFIFGAMSTLPGFFISSFCKNPYMITCVPFLFVYIWNVAIDKIVANMLVSDNVVNFELVQCFYPDSLTNLLFFEEYNQYFRITFCFNMLQITCCLVGYILIMNRRTDKGV